MKKTIPFDLFGPNQYLYFDILRLAELEIAIGTPMSSFLQSENTGVNFCLAGLMVGLKHHDHKATRLQYAEKIQAHLENGGQLTDISGPLMQAILATGIYGKELAKMAVEYKNDEPLAPEDADSKNE